MKKKVWKIMKIVLLALAAIIILVILIISVMAGKNKKQMNACVEETLKKISEGHQVIEVDTGEYAEMKAYGVLKFRNRQYAIEGIGNLSVMTVNAGVMQMASIIFSPFEKELPLFCIDYMYMLSTRKAYLELYDVVEEKTDDYMAWMEKYDKLRNNYPELEETQGASGWYDYLITTSIYKNGTAKQDEQLRAILSDMVGIYLEQADSLDLLTAEQKAVKCDSIKSYGDRLIDEGGVSTTFMKSALGEDVLRGFFDQVFFGSAKYR